MQEKIDNLCQLTGAMHHTIDVLIKELEKMNANPYVIKSAKDSVQRHRDKFQSIQKILTDEA